MRIHCAIPKLSNSGTEAYCRFEDVNNVLWLSHALAMDYAVLLRDLRPFLEYIVMSKQLQFQFADLQPINRYCIWYSRAISM